ncbi:MAG: YeiH family protein, partial [Aeromonas sp.]
MPHSTAHSNQPSHPFAPLGQGQWWLGIALAALLAAAGMGLAELPQAKGLGLSALTIAIVLGIVVGNTLFPRIAHHCAAGVDFSKNKLLRAGIILYGFRITFQQIGDIGWSGVIIDILIIGFTFILALQLGTRVFKLDKQTSMLIGAGSAICGAAAVMAAEPVIKGQAHKASVAVATVVVFGTLAMFLYPLAYPYLGLSEAHYGIFAGSTIHEVAQVVAAGKSVGDQAAATAVIVKMMRVMMLAPFLLIL